MNASDLYALRERFNQDRTLLCFNGPISRSLIEELGNALKNYLEVDRARPAEAMDVFSAYIEMTQNIRQYARRRGYVDGDSAATVVIARSDTDQYMVSAGNVVDSDEGQRLVQRVQELAAMDKTALKAAYKEQLRKPRVGDAASGAGLGLIDIARRSNGRLEASLSKHDETRSFFSLSVVI
jgi:hypothetical protein